MQQPSFQEWGFARAKHQGSWCLLFLWCAPCWWLGSADRGIFVKVPWKFCEGVGESQSAFWREWPSKPCQKNCPIRNNLSWEEDSVMLAACLQGYEEVIRDDLVWFGRWWVNLYKRSCCSTWVPRKINMEFAKDSRNMFLFAKNGCSRIKEFWSTIIYNKYKQNDYHILWQAPAVFPPTVRSLLNANQGRSSAEMLPGDAATGSVVWSTCIIVYCIVWFVCVCARPYSFTYLRNRCSLGLSWLWTKSRHAETRFALFERKQHG